MKYNRFPKRDAIKNYFPLPNRIFSLGLSTGEISVYSYLLYREDRKTYQCHPRDELSRIFSSKIKALQQ